MRIVLIFITLALGAQPPRGPQPLFRALDEDRNGVLSAAELSKAPAALKSFDADDDGFVSAAEFRSGGLSREARETVETLSAFDKNGDGRITAAELPERMQGLMARGDRDKDGALSREEVTKLAAGMKPQEDEFRGPPDRVFDALHVSKEGRLTAADIAAAAKSLLTLDTDGDGQLGESEISPRRGEFRKRR